MTKERKSGAANRSRKAPGWCATILIALAAATGCLYVYDGLYAQKIRCVDPGPYLKAQWELVAAGKISRDEFERRLDRLEGILDRQSPNTVVLLKDAVVRNGEEIGP